MTLSDFQIEALRALLRSRVDGEKMYLTYGELAEDMGRDRARDAEAVAGALDALSGWFRDMGLPDVTSVVIPQSNADSNLMLPSDKAVEELGGRAAAQAEAARVRDFDWAGWRDG